EMVCSQKGFLLMLQKLGDDKVRSERYVRLLQEMRVEGVIAVPHVSGVHRDEIALIQEWGIPVVQIDNYVPGSNTDYVGCDNRLGAKMAADHLLSLGHERFGIVSSVPLSLSCIAERIEAFHQAVDQRGTTTVHVIAAEKSEHNAYEFGRRATHTLLDLPLPPTAVFATSAPTAVAVLRAIRERGLRCPEDVAVVAFDDEQFAGYLETALTAVHWPAFEIGRTASELLIRRIMKEETEPVRHILLKPVLIHRESTLGRGVTLESNLNHEHSKEVHL
ncbi:MAG: substrate-binding domain-containing protein, partial [Armatimonadota bacterium]|nr:substrate-binding domain-containing protein [bacterium]MDW8321898.1 substrate-binding domain-containing protein [Armatimonadota bacterium]